MTIATAEPETLIAIRHSSRENSMADMRQQFGAHRLCVVVMATLCFSLISGCASHAWPVPEGTPPNIAKACREQAALLENNKVGNLQERTGSEIAGAADDTIEDAKAAGRENMQAGHTRQDTFDQCLQGNAVLIEPGDTT